jgi:hypothetical protein
MYNNTDNNSYFVMKNGNKKYYVDKYGYTYGREILDGIIRIELTSEMVIEAWGSPNDASEYITAYGSQVTYRYSFGTVTFMNGKVSSIYLN